MLGNLAQVSPHFHTESRSGQPSAAGYRDGCRCDECRTAHTTKARERRQRQRAGYVEPLTRVDPGPTREGLRWLRDEAGMTWVQISGLTGADKTTLNRALVREKMVAASTEQSVLAAIAQLKANPKLLKRDALLLDSSWSRWQYQALLARGWTQDMIEAEAGVGVPLKPKVQRRTVDAYDRVFQKLHDQWGPQRRTAVLAWRKGWLPSDCYLWEKGDTRIIPGSLHSDLIAEAATFSTPPFARGERVREMLRGLGQWSQSICARTAYRNWAEHLGIPMDDYMTEAPSDAVDGRGRIVLWCTKHPHEVPEVWLD